MLTHRDTDHVSRPLCERRCHLVAQPCASAWRVAQTPPCHASWTPHAFSRWHTFWHKRKRAQANHLTDGRGVFCTRAHGTDWAMSESVSAAACMSLRAAAGSVPARQLAPANPLPHMHPLRRPACHWPCASAPVPSTEREPSSTLRASASATACPHRRSADTPVHKGRGQATFSPAQAR